MSDLSAGRRVVRRSVIAYLMPLLPAVVVIPLAFVAIAPDTATGARIALGAAVAIYAIWSVRHVMIGVWLEPDGVLIRNVMSSRRLRWSEIERFEMGWWRRLRGGLSSYECGIARLMDGGQVTIYALNPPWGDHGPVPKLLAELNARLALATGREDPGGPARATPAAASASAERPTGFAWKTLIGVGIIGYFAIRIFLEFF
jgi:hypothetical protein